MTPIPFEPQRIIDGSRTCGAAALTMAYRSLGMECRQTDVWRRVAEEIRPGVKASRTHRLALDAIQSGCAAVVLQAERPAIMLAQLIDADARVILNHRVDRQSHLGHFSVLLGFDGEKLEFHDPHRGPNRLLPWNEFADLWLPGNGQRDRQPKEAAGSPTCTAPSLQTDGEESRPAPNRTAQQSEIVGRVLVAIGAACAQTRSCRKCGTAPPVHWTCPRCDFRVPIGPAGAVRCVMRECSQRSWARLFCPRCDWAVTDLI